MKFNNVKYLILSLGIALQFTSIMSVEAAWVRPNPSNFCQNGVFPNCSDYPSDSRSIAFSSRGTNYDDFNELNYLVCNSSNANYDSYNDTFGKYYIEFKPNSVGTSCSFISGNVKTFNDGDVLTWRVRQNNGTTFYGRSKFQFNFINQTYDGSAPVFHWWYDLGKKYNSVNYAYLPDLPDMNGTGDNFYFAQPRHGSWIFYNYLYDIDLKTVQYIGNQVLRDKFIYVDSLASTDNIWLVDTALNKAWSMTESDINVISDFMFGNFTFSDDLLNNAGWTDSYDVYINSGGNSFLPQTYGNFIGSSYNNLYVGSKSFKGFNIGISYQKNYEFQGPEYGNGSGNNNSSSAILNDYKQCINEYQPLQDIVNYSVQCVKITTNGGLSGDYYYDQYLDYVINLDYYKENDLTYTGVIKSASCKSFINAAENYYDALNNSGLYHDHIFEIESYIGLGGNIDIEKKCGVYPGTDIYSDMEISRSCKWFGVGCGYTGNNIMGFVYNNTRGFFTSFFDESFGEIKTSYQEGIDYFGDLSCENPYGKSYTWGNFLLIFVSAWLVFSLIIIL